MYLRPTVCFHTMRAPHRTTAVLKCTTGSMLHTHIGVFVFARRVLFVSVSTNTCSAAAAAAAVQNRLSDKKPEHWPRL